MTTIFAFLFSVISAFAQQYLINGSQDACPADIVTYTVTGSPAPATYSWQVTSPNGNIINYVSAGCEILWNIAGSALVEVMLYDGSGGLLGQANLSVNVHALPAPVMTTSFAGECISFSEHAPVIDPSDCWNVCEDAQVEYYVNPFDPASSYSWSAAGGQPGAVAGNTYPVTWGTMGNGWVMVTETNQFGCSASDSQCVKINESPQAIIGADVPHGNCQSMNAQMTVCSGQIVQLTGDAILGSTNSPIIGWSWDFGDGEVSSLQNPEHDWTAQGSYIMTLTVTNACNCTGTCQIEVLVEPLTGVNIECIGPVCPNTTQTYYTDAVNCSQYNWQVTGGTITTPATITPPSPEVTIQWGSGANGPGILCLSNSPIQYCSDYCPSTTCVEVPIISSTSTIAGPALACLNEQYCYSVAQLTGSLYNWAVSGGTIDLGQSTNEIFVTWDIPGQGSVSVTYNNGFLDCGGSGSLNVDVLSPFTISGPAEICPDDILVLDVQNPAGNVMNWTATDGNGNITNLGSSTGQLSFTWTLGPGEYIITATPQGGINYCNANSTLPLLVHTPPPVPSGIAGQDVVCPASAQLYYAPSATSAITYNWTATGGFPTQGVGSQFSVNWGGSPPCQLQLTQTSSITGCTSDPYTLPITLRTYIEPTFAAAPDACINTEETYQITNDYPGNGNYHYDNITWEVIPATAGSVTAGQGGLSATIKWNNTVMTGVVIRVKTRLCGVDRNSINQITLNLVGQGNVQVTPNGITVCEGVSQTFSYTGASGTAVWDYGNGPTALNYNTWNLNGQTGGPFTYPVSVVVTDGNGCEATGSTLISITPAPAIAIGFSAPCVDGVTPVQLTALAPNGGSYSYSWNTNVTTTGISVNTPGTYTVTITGVSPNPNLCSNSLSQTLNTCTGGPTGCPSYPGAGTPVFSVNFNPPTCGSYQFNSSFTPPSGFTIINYQYFFGDGTSDQGQTLTTVIHQYPLAASYTANLKISFSDNTNTYCAYAQVNVDVEAVGDFATTLTCPLTTSPNQYQVTFNDFSTYLNPVNSYNWQWASSGAQPNVVAHTPTVAMLPGTYQVALTIYYPSSSFSCEVEHTVVIPDMPDADFTVVDPIQPLPAGPFCEALSLVEFVADNSNVHHALWDFGDASFYSPLFPATTIDAKRVYKDASVPQNPTVVLTLYDDYGCTYQSDTTFLINDNTLGGSTHPALPGYVSFCPGGSDVLFYNQGNFPSPTSFLWSNGATTSAINVNVTGSYYLTVYDDPTGCYNALTGFSNALTYNMPTANIYGDLTICEGEDILLDGTSGITGSGYTFNWVVTDPQSNTINFSGPIFNLSQAFAGNYNVTLTIASANPACQTTASAVVEVAAVPPVPIITANPSPPCENQAIQLSVNPMGNYVNWSTGQNNANIQVVSAGLYKATLTNAAGCTSTNSIEVYRNPFGGWLTTGCYQFCDTIDIVIPGSGTLEYYKWTWLIDGSAVNSGSQSVVPDLIIPAGTAPGIYNVTLYLELNYGNNDVCGSIVETLEITIRHCPCDAEPDIRLYCATPQINEGIWPHTYHFTINTGLQLPCTPTAQVQVTSPDGGVVLLPSSVQPNMLEGLIQTTLSYPSNVCFDLDITDPNEPACNCTYTLCHRLPECPYPSECDATIDLINVVCLGIFNGHPRYSFDLNVNISNPNQLFVSFNAISQGQLSGLGGTVITGPGTFTFSGVFDDWNPANGFCIELSMYDFSNNTICVRTVCEDNPPGDCDNNPLRSGQVQPGLPKVILPTLLKIIPNPASGMTYIEFSVNEAAGKVTITDLQGRIVRQWEVNTQQGKLELDVASIGRGIYTCKLVTGEGKVITKKIVVL